MPGGRYLSLPGFSPELIFTQLVNDNNKFIYEKTLKTKTDDSFLNLQSFLYITSKQITKILFYTPVTPHQVILLSLIFGLFASFLLIQQNIYPVIAGAVLLFYKNVLDKVDGSLARAKGLDSRRGRFYDSISDFIVTLALFSAISYYLYLKYRNPVVFATGFAAMIFSMLQCSFFIFYQVSFIKISGKDTINRLIETVTEEDKSSRDKWTLLLQKSFQLIYGWQDKIMFMLDEKLKNKLISEFNIPADKFNLLWYKNKSFLTFSSSLSIGTHMLLIAVFAVLRSFEIYLFVNIILMNLLLICFVVYHYISIKNNLISH
jgi:phosphatidylglycerophosphate synthase